MIFIILSYIHSRKQFNAKYEDLIFTLLTTERTKWFIQVYTQDIEITIKNYIINNMAHKTINNLKAKIKNSSSVINL